MLVKRSANAKRASNYKLYNTVRSQLCVTYRLKKCVNMRVSLSFVPYNLSLTFLR